MRLIILILQYIAYAIRALLSHSDVHVYRIGGVFDVQTHYMYELGRGVHEISAMQRVNGKHVDIRYFMNFII
jgi:hypothetical protein